ncbi:Alpha/Beta hydrolase protein, partial [Syncephalis pseudoplumigaleata]
GETQPLFVFHHGAGQSALSFALTARELRQRTNNQCAIACYDCRGHGKCNDDLTRTANDNDLSLARLTQDLVEVVRQVQQHPKQSIILVGHSMGGAVVVDAVARKLIAPMTGVVVLDVVEGSAMESLAYMSAFIQSRPVAFHS